ncbi:hypothetical protein [Marinobacter apostichopi]|uniref:hypothetical protein n=1 Tax=Marinobacter apostichopi TaxID=3035454 RepID=UPI00257359D5|nr:hypothetical protein [Marinobacter sp. LA51]
MSLKGLIVGLLCAVSIVGCGGSSDGGSGSSAQTKGSTSDVEVKTGYFVDAPVFGLRYRTNSRAGTTDELGRFDYLPGERVVFSIGGTVLGSAEAGDIMTPGSLDDTGQWDGPQAINIARLLITLDADQNPLNGIQITDEMHTVFSDLEFDLSQDSERLGASSALQRAMQEAGRVGLVSVFAARNHLAYVAQRLPEQPTEADIINLIDTGPNYTGRQTPMTATPDNLRKAAQVFWADPKDIAPDLHWLSRTFDPVLLREMIDRDLRGEVQPYGVRLYGDIAVNTEGEFESANLLVSLDGYSNDQWVYRGAIYAQVSHDPELKLTHVPTGEIEDDEIELNAYEYALFFDNLQVSAKYKKCKNSGSAQCIEADLEESSKDDTVVLGIHGGINIIRALDNPFQTYSLMDLTLRKLNSEEFVHLVAEAPHWYSEHGEALPEDLAAGTQLSGTLNVMHWELGAYSINGTVSAKTQNGPVSYAHFNFSRADGSKFGELRTIPLPSIVALEERVRSEVFTPSGIPSGEFDVYRLETPLTGEEKLTEASPVWAFDTIRYEIVGDTTDPTIPVEVVLKNPPFPIDPDGDPVIDWEFSWIVNGKKAYASFDEFGTSRLPLVLGLQSTATTVCIRNRTTYEDTVMDIALGIDLTRETGVEHTVNFEDAVCDSL